MANLHASDLENVHQCLIVAIQQKRPIEEITIMIEQQPEVVVQKGDKFPLTPWEEAIDMYSRDSRSVSILHVMMKHYPDVVKVPAQSGDLMLHRFLSTTMRPNSSSDEAEKLKIVECLVTAYPQALMIRGHFDLLPIETAMRRIECNLSNALGLLGFLMKTCPKALLLHNSDGIPALCRLGNYFTPRLEPILRLVLEHCPQALECGQWGSGELPLDRWAAWQYMNLSMVRLLLQKIPQALQVTNTRGDLPLHIVCGDRAYSDEDEAHWIELIDYMVSEWRGALDATGRDGFLPFELVIMQKEATHARTALVERLVPTGSGSPLYAACKCLSAKFFPLGTRSTVAYVLSFLDRDPKSLFQRDPGTGNLPLHELVQALMNIPGDCERMIMCLEECLKRWPESTKEPDQKGKLTLQQLLRRGRVYSDNALRLFIESCPQIVETAEVKGDEAGFLPWQVAGMYSTSVETIYELLRLYPESIEHSRRSSDGAIYLSDITMRKRQRVE